MHSQFVELTQKYGFQYPEEFFTFWELIRRLDDGPKQLWEKLGLSLTGPFDLLRGRFDEQEPELSFLLHMRYYMDPPEFFTLFTGHTDGLHYGYWLDDPAEGPSCVASYYNRDIYELSFDGDTLFEAVRLRLERCYSGTFECMEDDPKNTDAYEDDIEWMDDFRNKLMEHVTGERQETSDDYAQEYESGARMHGVIAQTYNGIGIVVPPEMYRPLSVDDPVLWENLKSGVDTALFVEGALANLNGGYPGTALKLGQDLWAIDGESNRQFSCQLLDSAYEKLGRPLLQQALRSHMEHGSRMNVDIGHGFSYPTREL